MKKIVGLFCIVLAIYCIYFPFSYFKKDADKAEVHLHHILLNSQEEAEKVKKQIEDREKSFGELAEELSECPSKDQKGDLGFYERGRILPEVEKYAFKTQKNIISEPIKTQEGWHLVKVSDIKYFSDKNNFTKI